MGRILVGLCIAVLAATSAWAQDREVTFAYQDMVNPFRAVIDTHALERETGYKINWRRFGGGGDVIRAMASGDVQIGEAGSSPIAAAVAQGLPLELFWILENIADAEALVVRDGSGITSVAGLRGKKIGVPFVSTSHFHLIFAMELAGLKQSDARIVNMRPQEIAAAWQRGDIDATFIWNPVLAIVKKTGKVLVTSGELSKKGKATFDGLVVNKNWAKKHKDFLVTLVKTIAREDAKYQKEGRSWIATSPEVISIAKVSGAKREDVLPSMSLYGFPTLQEQASAAWLGGGANGGAAKALLETSKFLKEQGRIEDVKPDYASFVDPEYVRAAMK